MTLREFLLKSYGVDLLAQGNSIVAHIRQHVQNIDMLASKEVKDLNYEDLRDIFVAIILDNPSKYAVFYNEAWNSFKKEALRLNFTESEIESIEKRH